MRTEIKTLNRLTYVVKYPDTFSETDTSPVLMFLHGAGTRGTDINVLLNNVVFSEIEKHQTLPFVIVAPLCSENTWFDMWDCLKALVVEIASWSFTDSERIYLMGNSMGGYGTWQLAMSMPEYFAAITPICGGGMYWNAERLVNVPVWAFHGGRDRCVFPEESVKMVNAVNNCGGQAKLTVYPENEHDSWTDTYRNREVFDWLLSHKNKNAAVLATRYDDAKAYG